MINIFVKKLDSYTERQPVKVSHVPSTINQNEDPYVDVANMGQNDVIFLALLFNLELTGTSTNRTILNNIGKSIVQNLRIILNGNEVKSMSLRIN